MKNTFENSLKQSLENLELPYDASAWNAMQAKLNANASASSNGMESQIKEQLNSIEYPYNAAAWTALNARLDGKNSGGSKGKWFVAAGILALVSVGSYFLFTDSDNSESPSKKAETNQAAGSNAQVSPTAEKQANSTNTSNSQGTSAANPENSSENSSSAVATPEVNPRTTPTSQGTGNPSTHTPSTSAGSGASSLGSQSPNRLGDSGSGSGTPAVTNRPWKYISPEIISMCQGIPVQIKNENSYPISIIFPNGSNWTGREGSITTLTPSFEGLYRVGYVRDNAFIEKETFIAQPKPDADFEFVDLTKTYLNGLPTTEVRATVNGSDFNWSYGNIQKTGSAAAPHFFKKGNHEITLTVTGASGCKSEVTKNVLITEDYNLMAMNAFDPMDTEPKNNTFMPYALKERQVQFTMIIVDPNDGHVVYETSDASAGWDGTDRQTGNLVKFETNYIWKVSLANPEVGEKRDYVGTVLPIQRK